MTFYERNLLCVIVSLEPNLV